LSKPYTKASRARTPRPLGADALRALATAYVARYQTSSGKLALYLRRKLSERGWDGADDPPVAEIVDRFVALGYVDDQNYANARAAVLAGRGYGPRRVSDALRAAGIDQSNVEPVTQNDDEVRRIAHIYAKRRRIGPYATKEANPDLIRKWTAAMINAGHSYTLAREIACQPREAD
jgi:regulatory protein